MERFLPVWMRNNASWAVDSVRVRVMRVVRHQRRDPENLAHPRGGSSRTHAARYRSRDSSTPVKPGPCRKCPGTPKPPSPPRRTAQDAAASAPPPTDSRSPRQDPRTTRKMVSLSIRGHFCSQPSAYACEGPLRTPVVQLPVPASPPTSSDACNHPNPKHRPASGVAAHLIFRLLRRVSGATYASIRMISVTPAFFAVWKKSYAPCRLPWSAASRCASCPSHCTRRTCPSAARHHSSNEYWVWTCRCVKDRDTTTSRIQIHLRAGDAPSFKPSRQVESEQLGGPLHNLWLCFTLFIASCV